MKARKTNRGFDIIESQDKGGHSFSIQKSSSDDNAIWIGIDNPKPQCMAMQAKSLGVDTNETTGWVDYPIPKAVLLITRMHLSQEQVRELLPVLQKFVDTGEIV